MPRERAMYLLDIVQAIDAIADFTKGTSFDDFLASPLLQAAVERKVEIVGEAIRQLEMHYPGASSSLPEARLAIGMRHHLAHGYFSTDLQELWNTAKHELGPLRDSAQAQLEIP